MGPDVLLALAAAALALVLAAAGAVLGAAGLALALARAGPPVTVVVNLEEVVAFARPLGEDDGDDGEDGGDPDPPPWGNRFSDN